MAVFAALVVCIIIGTMWLAQSHLDRKQARLEAEAMRSEYNRMWGDLERTRRGLKQAQIDLDSCKARVARIPATTTRYIIRTKQGSWWTANVVDTILLTDESSIDSMGGWRWFNWPVDSLQGVRQDTTLRW